MNDLSTIINNGGIEVLEGKLFSCVQPVCPLEHFFAPGVYVRKITMPAGAVILGHEHKTEHLNIVQSGEAEVVIDGKPRRITGPCVFTSKAGVRKALLIIREMVWLTVHPTDETDLGKLEEALIVKSATFIAQRNLMT